MLKTERKPVSVGEMLVEESSETAQVDTRRLGQGDGRASQIVNELCNDRRAVTADTALMLARVFGEHAEFWLNTQRRIELWEALHTPARRQRIERARELRSVA